MADYMITEATWLQVQTDRVGSVLKAQMNHNQAYTQNELADLIRRTFPKDTYTNAELITIRDNLVVEGVIQTV